MATIDIKRSAATILSPLIDDTSKRTKVLNGEDYIVLKFSHDSFVELYVGDYVEWDGETYTMKQAPTYKKVSTRKYEYELRFEGPYAELKDAMFLLDSEGEFSLTGKAEDFVDLIVTNLNRVHGAGSYYTGSVTSTDFKHLEFKNENCLEVLQRICEEYELEYYFSAGININLTTEIGNSTGLNFQYNDGLRNIKRLKVGDKDLVTRLYAYGAERNIDHNYGASRLHLPTGTYPNGYIEDGVSNYGIREMVKHFDDIFPHFDGTVTSTAANNKIIDTSINFDLNSYLIEGTTAKIVFRTGDLAGMEFEILGYNVSTDEVTFKSYTDESGLELPNATLNPAIGDEFTFVDITTAETALAVKALSFLAEFSSPNLIYDVEVDWHELQQDTTTIDVGDLITITDTQLASGGVEHRVLEFSQSITNEYKYSFKLGEKLPDRILSRTRIKRDRDNIRRDVRLFGSRATIDDRRTNTLATKKSATFVSATAPTNPDDEVSEGDLWFSTADPASGGSRIYRFDGEDWDQEIGDLTQEVIESGEVEVEINRQVDYTTCPHSSTTNINIGTTADDISFMIKYVAERNMGTVQKQLGTVNVLYDDVSSTVYCGGRSHIGPRLDFDIQADESSGVLRLNIVVGSANTNNLSFDYIVISKFLEP